MDEEEDLEVPCTDQEPHPAHPLSPVAYCPGLPDPGRRHRPQVVPDLREPGDDWNHPVDHGPPVDGAPTIEAWRQHECRDPERYMGKTAQSWYEAHNSLEVNLSRAQLMVVGLKTDLKAALETINRQVLENVELKADRERHAEICPLMNQTGPQPCTVCDGRGCPDCDPRTFGEKLDNWMADRPVDLDGWVPLVITDREMTTRFEWWVGSDIDATDQTDGMAVTPQPETFGGWWQSHIETLELVHRKAEEYGSNSLAQIGRMYARARGRDVIEDAEALEVGCAVYAYGKMERVMDALLRDRLPSVDTWYDLMIYAAMAQYIRTWRKWP